MKGKYTLDEPEWDEISEDAKDLVRRMLEYDPNKRISAGEARSHKWITKHAAGDKVEKIVASKTLSNMKNFRVIIYLIIAIGWNKIEKSNIGVYCITISFKGRDQRLRENVLIVRHKWWW